MDTSFIWKNCLDGVVQHVSPQHFTTWFRPIKVLGGDENSIELEVPNRFFLEWIKEHYLPLIQDMLRKNTHREYSLVWKVAEEVFRKPGIKKANAKASKTRALKSTSHGLSTKYTFENFVVGKANEFAHAACFAISKSLGSKYNPLFIFGGVGLGKTHLLQAIGNRVLHASSGMNVCYYTSERFMNEFISYVSRNKMMDFRKKFRNVDLLLIDDIQFWGGKERTQEEFFHTFNSLYEAHKQIVITSDKFPKDVARIEERLRSRFEWGLVADIHPPDTEMKMAILRAKAEAEGIILPDGVIAWLASVGGSNIRELEGFFNRIVAVSSLTNQEITLPMSKDALKNLIRAEKEKVLSINEIQKTVAAFFNIKLSELSSKRRHRTIALPRQIAMYLAREYGNFSYPEIGSSFGGKDHSTAIHAYKKIKNVLNVDGEMKRTVVAIKNHLV
jgi:chromosomal replication initiator protein